MLCAACAAETATRPCVECGADPWLLGAYRYEARLGAGGFGVTWLAAGPHGPVAVKDVPVPISAGPKEIELLRREVRVLGELDHPAIPRVLDHQVVGTGRERRVIVVLSYLDGETLLAEGAHRRYAEADVADVVGKLTDILEYLHGLAPPVVHRDIKPGNVIRRPDGSLALVDFGSVRDFVPETLADGTIAGTFGYMAPEQFRGEAYEATDFYAVGALAWWMLTRVEPRARMTATGFRWRDKLQAGPALVSLLEGLLEPDPRKRLSKPADVRARLADAPPQAKVGLEARLAAIVSPVPVTASLASEPVVRFLGIGGEIPRVIRTGEGIGLGLRRRPPRHAIAVLARNNCRMQAIALYKRRAAVSLDEATRAVAAIVETEPAHAVDLDAVAFALAVRGWEGGIEEYIRRTGETRARAEEVLDAVDEVAQRAAGSAGAPRPRRDGIPEDAPSAWSLPALARMLPWMKGRK